MEGSSGILRLEKEDSLFWGEDNGVFEADEFCKLQDQSKINIVQVSKAGTVVQVITDYTCSMLTYMQVTETYDYKK